jgi:hypothetical protein
MYNLESISSTCFERHSVHHQEHNCSLVYVFSHRFSVKDRSFLVSCSMGPCVFCVYSRSHVVFMSMCVSWLLLFVLRGVDVWSLYCVFCTNGFWCVYSVRLVMVFGHMVTISRLVLDWQGTVRRGMYRVSGWWWRAVYY